MESSPTVVIKVKYGDVLRRFETQFVDKGQCLSMDGLRNKIVSLFSFAPDTELMLTYIDEDNDVVNLVDDNDIRDVIKQGLNPLRITVKVNSGKNGEQYAWLSRSSTPLRSRQVKQPLENLHAGMSEILSTMPGPLRETLVKVSTDLASKASSSAPDISELVDGLAKLGLSCLGQIPESQPGLPSSMQGGVSKSTDTTETTEVGLSKVDPAATSETQPTDSSNSDSMEGLKPGASFENVVKIPSITGVKMGSSPFDFSAVAAALESQNMNDALPFYDYLLRPVPICPRSNLSHSGRKEKFKKTVEMLPLSPVAYDAGKIVEPSSVPSNLPPVMNKVTTVEVARSPHEPNFESNHANVDVSSRKAGEYIDVRERAALLSAKNKSPFSGKSVGNVSTLEPYSFEEIVAQMTNSRNDDFRKFVGPTLPTSAMNECLFSGIAVGNASTLKPYSFKEIVAQMTNSQNDGFRKSAGPTLPTSAMNECPFSGIAVGNISTVQPCNSSEAITSRRSINQNDGHQNTVHHGIACDGCDVCPITGPRFKSKVKVNYDLCSTCFEKMGNDVDYVQMDCPVVRQNYKPSFGGFGKYSDPISSPGTMKECPFSGLAAGTVSSTVAPYNSSELISSSSVSEDDGRQDTVHLGFTCDGCDVHPITGPRFKSKVKEDYDLCSTCFEKMGNDADYIRIDCQAVHQSHMSSVGGLGNSAGCPIVPTNAMNQFPFSGIAVGNVSTVPPYNSSQTISIASRSISQDHGHQNTVHYRIACNGCDVHPITGLRFKSKVKEDYDLCSACFEKMGNDADYIQMDCPEVPQSHMSSVGGFGKSSGIGVGNVSTVPPYNLPDAISSMKSFSLNDDCRNSVHHGITCDGCDVHPITGQRFKSKVKVDYDLCRTCFEKMGNDADYIRMDFPVVCQSRMSFIGCSHDSQATSEGPPVLPLGYSGRMIKPFATKLDNCFVEDVNVIDGTAMAPLTPFTKIWRMKNNGAVGWLQGTQLVWIGGDKLSSTLSVELKIPEGGVWMGQELDVMVDFISPKLPGGYISYWRMATPSGEKFGQRIWVLIQVDASGKNSLHETIRNLNLNLPPVSSGLDGTEIMNIEPEPLVKGSHPQPDNSVNIVELVQPETEQDLKLPANDSLLVGNGASSCSVPFTASLSVSYPSDLPPALSSVPFPLPPQAKLEASVTSHSAVNDLRGKNQVEEKLLRELEEMGFKQTDLNKAILRKNEYSLEQALDELCGGAEWDSILEELEEMGFYDQETNKMLLKKNDGSIKRVVMDLIAGEMN